MLNNLQQRFDRQAINQLRAEVSTLAQKIDELEESLYYAQQNADFWHDHSVDMRQALEDENFATHRSVGLNKEGELMVVRTDV